MMPYVAFTTPLFDVLSQVGRFADVPSRAIIAAALVRREIPFNA